MESTKFFIVVEGNLQDGPNTAECTAASLAAIFNEGVFNLPFRMHIIRCSSILLFLHLLLITAVYFKDFILYLFVNFSYSKLNEFPFTVCYYPFRFRALKPLH